MTDPERASNLRGTAPANAAECVAGDETSGRLVHGIASRAVQESPVVVGTRAELGALHDDPTNGSAEEVASEPLVLTGPRAWIRASADAATIVGVWLVGASFFFRAVWSSGFRTGIGDSHDSVQLTYLQEHWYQVFLGHASWRDPGMFYPLKGVLGWSDALVLFEVFYTPLRLLGADMFLAAQLTVILFSLVGFASFVCLARVAFGVQRWIALIGGLAFTFANNLWMHVYWYQLLTVWLVPGIVLLGVLAFRSFAGHRLRSLVLGAAFGLLVALMFFTDFYVAWFSSIAAGIAFVILLAFGRRPLLRTLGKGLRSSWLLVVTMAAAFAIGLVPFLITYLPAQRTVHHLSYRTIMLFAPRPQDLINVGTGNILWTSAVHHVVPSGDLSYSVRNYAITPLLVLLAVAGATLALWMRRSEASHGWPTTTRWAAVLAAAALVLTVLPVRTQFGSLWAVMWHIPGATVIRRTNRLGVVTGLVASLAAVCAVSAIYSVRGRQPYRFLWRATVVVLLALAVLEQVNTTPMGPRMTGASGLDRAAQLRFLRSATAPPPACRSFYVLDRRHTSLAPAGAAGYETAVTDQIDAMLISQKYGIPTLNGYTSHQPPGWSLLDPFAPRYLAAVRSWVNEHHLEAGLCQLDLGAMRWQKEAALPIATAAKPTG